MSGWTYFPVSTFPAPYEIVWCRFPHDEKLGDPGPYPRPGLVRNAAIDDEGNPEVELVYGTTNLKMLQRRHDFFVTKQSEMDACGLFRATRFDLDKVLWVPWASEWFDTLTGYTSPVLGKLTSEGVKVLQITVSLKKERERRLAEAKDIPPDPETEL